jgi:hypothetical protein
MPSLLGIADSSIHSTPNKQSSTITTEIESSPIAIESTIRVSRLTKLRHNLTKRPSLYLRSRRIPSAAPPIAASSPLPALHDLETDGPNDMSTTEETQPLTASAPPPVPFSRLREIANSVRNPTHAKCNLSDHLPGLRSCPVISISLRTLLHRILERDHHQHNPTNTRQRDIYTHYATTIQIRHQ